MEKINKNYITNFERNKWIEEFVQQRSPVPAVIAEEEFAKHFGIGEKRTYRMVLKLADENEHLTLKRGTLYYEKV